MRARILIFGLAILLAVNPAFAREEIRSFASSTVLGTDGTVDVTETLDVNAEGDQIRHGIFRDLFTVLRNPDGSKFYSALKVLSVERDGNKEPYSTEGIGNGERIRIGDADTVIDPGAHHYVLRYTMSRMARFFADHDELYWNATGNFWQFPIVSAVATITLPKGAVIAKLVAYTGPPGSTAQDATISRTADNTATFHANRELAPGDGMTIAAAFQKGIVLPAAGPGNWLSDHRELIVPPLAVLIVLLFNLFAWLRVGRDPKRGTIIPLFHPPAGLSPAMSEWVHRMGFGKSGWNAFTANIFDLGAKGLLTIDNTGKKLQLATTAAKPPADLPADEKLIYEYVGTKGTVSVDKTNGAALNTSRANMLTAITRPNRNLYFSNNAGFVILGALLAFACLAVMVYLDVLDLGWLVVAVVGGGIVAVVIAALRGRLPGSIFGMGFGLIWVAIVGINLIGAAGSVASPHFAVNLPALAAISIIVVTLAFGFLMRAATPVGRKLMDQLDGFIMYLNTAEKHRLNLTGEPPLTISRFEAVLPFAIALGVEKPWSDKFNAALAASEVPDAPSGLYTPLWYSGQNFSSQNLGASIAAISTSMTAAMASAVPSSSSSSGFSGGGSSGGGGGGGGGGGW